jgi:hypothetical protein
MMTALAVLPFAFLLSAGSDAAVQEARSLPIQPRAQPPAWMDWSKVQRGLAFARQQGLLLMTVWHPLSLVETYAARDIAPVLVEAGGLTRDYSSRLRRTAQQVNAMVASRSSAEEFLRLNYRTAYELGQMHAALGQAIPADRLGWKQSERRVMNQQSYAFVLYTFAFTPVLVMEVRGLPGAERTDALEAWYHLWSVLGYAMGVDDRLLPVDAATARETGMALRSAQFPSPGGTPAEGALRLLREELLYLISSRRGAAGAASNATAETILQPLAVSISQSPGLAEALSLGSQPLDALVRLAGPEQ